MSDIAIRVENLSKRYRIGLNEDIHDTFAGVITSFVRSPIKNMQRLRRLSRFEEDGRDPEDVIWALKDVSFEVKQGEVLGIIGRNGAGKTTLLKILSKITYPTTGRVELHGRVSSLLEVGTGFHPELTGRENIYLNGTILGMTRKEIDRKYDEIVDFSGVGKFIDTPVKRYSSGMRVRLAFSVAAYLEPEILLVDEVLAVGDTEFQKKCLGKMGEVAARGRTVLFVSHNMAAIKQLCSKSILIEGGKKNQIGDTNMVVDKYFSLFRLGHFVREGNGKARVIEAMIEKNGLPTESINVFENVWIKLIITASEDINDCVIGIKLLNMDNVVVFSINSQIIGVERLELKKDVKNIVRFNLKSVPLKNGKYELTVGINRKRNQRLECIDRVEGITSFNIFGVNNNHGITNIETDVFVNYHEKGERVFKEGKSFK